MLECLSCICIPRHLENFNHGLSKLLIHTAIQLSQCLNGLPGYTMLIFWVKISNDLASLHLTEQHNFYRPSRSLVSVMYWEPLLPSAAVLWVVSLITSETHKYSSKISSLNQNLAHLMFPLLTRSFKSSVSNSSAKSDAAGARSKRKYYLFYLILTLEEGYHCKSLDMLPFCSKCCLIFW